eukprot:366504-Chlamydomonas_euryale.AAC.2
MPHVLLLTTRTPEGASQFTRPHSQHVQKYCFIHIPIKDPIRFPGEERIFTRTMFKKLQEACGIHGMMAEVDWTEGVKMNSMPLHDGYRNMTCIRKGKFRGRVVAFLGETIKEGRGLFGNIAGYSLRDKSESHSVGSYKPDSDAINVDQPQTLLVSVKAPFVLQNKPLQRCVACMDKRMYHKFGFTTLLALSR